MTPAPPTPASSIIADAFARLEAEGRTTLRSHRWDGHQCHNSYVASDTYARYRAEATNLVQRACGEKSSFALELNRLAMGSATAQNSYYFAAVVGIIEAAHRAWKDGLLFDLRAAVSAEVLGDLSDQADALLRMDYAVGAACVSGAALEQAMRQLVVQHQVQGIDLSKTTLNALNDALAKAGIYDKNKHKQITAIAGTRNEAAHGHADKVVCDDVEYMVKFVPRFLADCLGK